MAAREKGKFTKEFAVKAILAVTIVLALVMTYSIYMRNRPEPFSTLYFDPQGLANGSYVAVLDNHADNKSIYTVQFFVDGNKTDELLVGVMPGQQANFSVLQYAPGFATPGATVEIKALRQNSTTLDIYATNRHNASVQPAG
jgi:hypothetical protein